MTTVDPTPAPERRPVRRPPGASGTAGRRFGALVGYVFQACLPTRRRLILALPCLTLLGTGLLARVLQTEVDDAFAELAAAAMFGLALPLGSLVIGDAVFGAEVRSGTLLFTWLTPTRLRDIVAARWLGGWLIALLTLVPSAGLAAVLAGEAELAGAMVVAAAAASAAHLAVFIAIGSIFRRAAVWSLAFVFLIEHLLAEALSGLAQWSPLWLGQNAWAGLAGLGRDFVRSGVPTGSTALVRLGVLTVLGLGLAVYGLRRLELTGERD